MERKNNESMIYEEGALVQRTTGCMIGRKIYQNDITINVGMRQLGRVSFGFSAVDD